MAKKVITYYVISKSNWQGDVWMIDAKFSGSRKEAMAAAYSNQQALESANNGDIKNDRNYRIVSKTELKKKYSISEYDFQMYR